MNFFKNVCKSKFLSNIVNKEFNGNFKLNITENAIKRLKNTLKDGQLLRISVTSGGCSGLKYCFSIDKIIEEDDIVIDINNNGKTKVVIDDLTCEYINGSTLEYKEQLIKSSFSIENNPNVKLGCGCGTSFDPVSIDKK